MSSPSRLGRILVANRGEIAIRVIHAIQEIGSKAVAVYSKEDAGAKHCCIADEAIVLQDDEGHELSGAAAYLDINAVLRAAKSSGAVGIHPGYGFLSEDVNFVVSCERAGIAFIGPPAQVVALFGDKTQAKKLATKHNVPVVPGSNHLNDPQDVRAFVEVHGLPILIKSVYGGGGRGLRIVTRIEELESAFRRCVSEAKATCGNGAVFVEKYIANPRHIEVQIVGDAEGDVVHLWDRDCSYQRRHQKVLEIAPAPHLDEEVRKRIHASALSIARGCGYINVGTVEFLLDRHGRYYFIELNPRIQVEHTVTEEVTGIDLVQTQIMIAQGASLARDLAIRQEAIRPRGYALQCRITCENPWKNFTPDVATITRYQLPQGPGIRVDSLLESLPKHTVISPHFDSLIAKLVVSSSSLPLTISRAIRALEHFHIEGPKTNITFLHLLLSRPQFASPSELSATFLRDTKELYDATKAPLEVLRQKERNALPKDEDDAHRVEVAASCNTADPNNPWHVGAPTAGTVTELNVTVGQTVSRGDQLMVLSVMKMEHIVLSEQRAVVDSISVVSSQHVINGELLLVLRPLEGNSSESCSTRSVGALDGHVTGEDWSSDVEELKKRRRLAWKHGGEERVARQRKAGKLVARERIKLLLDSGKDSFYEIGSIAGKATYANAPSVSSASLGERPSTASSSSSSSSAYMSPQPPSSAITDFIPANHIAGIGKIDNRPVLVGADDFTVRGGHADGGVFRKQSYAESIARRMRIPVVRLLDGSSGGGSVATLFEMGATYIPFLVGFPNAVAMLKEVPVVAVMLGPVVGFGSGRAMMTHFTVMVRGLSQLFVAGPPVVEQATRERLTKEDLGGVVVHGGNGSIDNIVDSEEEAFRQVRRYLSYMPRNVWTVARRIENGDPVARREEELLSIIPKNRRRTYDVRRVISLIVDVDTFFEIGASWGRSVVCGFARMGGYSVGVVASDCCVDGGCLTAMAAVKLRRHADLCNRFHIPVVSFVDQPGFAVGLTAEKEGTIRWGAELIATLYSLTVPWFSVILRRVFGVAGAAFVDHSDPNMRVAWPSGDWGSLPFEGGIEAAYKRTLEKQSSKEQAEIMLNDLRQKLESIRSPFRTAEGFGVEEIIDPRNTRPLLCRWVEMLYTGDLLLSSSNSSAGASGAETFMSPKL